MANKLSGVALAGGLVLAEAIHCPEMAPALAPAPSPWIAAPAEVPKHGKLARP